MVPRFVWASDSHLQVSAWMNRPTLVGDSYASFKQIVHYCLVLDLPLVLGGDTLDRKRPEPEVVAFLCRQLDLMRSANLPVYYILGQHDLDRDTPWFSVHPWPQRIHKQQVNIRGLTVYGLDWLPRGQLQAELALIPPDTNILACHQVWEELMGVGVTDGSLSEVPHVEWILTGDYHETRIFEVARAVHRRVSVLSAGSACLQAVNEPPGKVFFAVSSSDDDCVVPIQVQAIPLRTRRVIEIQIMTAQELAGFVQRAQAGAYAPDPTLDPEIQQCILRIRYSEAVPDVYRTIMEVAGPEDRLFLDPISVTNEVVVDFDALPQNAFDDMSNAVQSLASGNNQASVDAQRLLAAEKPEAEIELIYSEHTAASKSL